MFILCILRLTEDTGFIGIFQKQVKRKYLLSLLIFQFLNFLQIAIETIVNLCYHDHPHTTSVVLLNPNPKHIHLLQWLEPSNTKVEHPHKFPNPHMQFHLNILIKAPQVALIIPRHRSAKPLWDVAWSPI